MSELSIGEAYQEACKIIGDQQVKITLLERTLHQAELELKEAGERIVALTSASREEAPASVKAKTKHSH